MLARIGAACAASGDGADSGGAEARASLRLNPSEGARKRDGGGGGGQEGLPTCLLSSRSHPDPRSDTNASQSSDLDEQSVRPAINLPHLGSPNVQDRMGVAVDMLLVGFGHGGRVPGRIFTTSDRACGCEHNLVAHCGLRKGSVPRKFWHVDTSWSDIASALANGNESGDWCSNICQHGPNHNHARVEGAITRAMELCLSRACAHVRSRRACNRFRHRFIRRAAWEGLEPAGTNAAQLVGVNLEPIWDVPRPSGEAVRYPTNRLPRHMSQRKHEASSPEPPNSGGRPVGRLRAGHWRPPQDRYLMPTRFGYPFSSKMHSKQNTR